MTDFEINELSLDHQQMVEAMKSQLIIVLINRLGGDCDIPVSEIDATGKFNLAMSLDADAKLFHFVVLRKGQQP